MNCPNCGKEMTAGFLQWNRYLFWSVKRCKLMLPNPPPGSINFYDNSFLGLSHLLAHDCRSCQKVVIDYTHDGASFALSNPADESAH